MDVFHSDTDWSQGKLVKIRKLNPVGEDVYLEPDGTITRDEDKIIRAQRIFLHEYYKDGGKGATKILARYNKDDQGGTLENL